VLRLLLALALFASPQEGKAGGAITGKVRLAKEAKKKVMVVKYTGPGIEKRKQPAPSPAVVWIKDAPKTEVTAGKLSILQQGLEFRPRVAAVTTGSTVEFPNGDDLFHNVFALTGTKNDFDLGKFPKDTDPVPAKTLKIAGRVDIRCKIHEHMRGFIHVFKHPYFAVAEEDGTFSIPNVPPGKYTLVAWSEDYEEIEKPVDVTAAGAKIDLEIVRLDERPAGRESNAGCCSAR
jgi:plastocyanin